MTPRIVAFGIGAALAASAIVTGCCALVCLWGAATDG
jgi:hypothetical protein